MEHQVRLSPKDQSQHSQESKLFDASTNQTSQRGGPGGTRATDGVRPEPKRAFSRHGALQSVFPPIIPLDVFIGLCAT